MRVGSNLLGKRPQPLLGWLASALASAAWACGGWQVTDRGRLVRVQLSVPKGQSRVAVSIEVVRILAKQSSNSPFRSQPLHQRIPSGMPLPVLFYSLSESSFPRSVGLSSAHPFSRSNPTFLPSPCALCASLCDLTQRCFLGSLWTPPEPRVSAPLSPCCACCLPSITSGHRSALEVYPTPA